jgi:hypothetical protein
MTGLAAADRQRLAKLLGMAGSQHDGEALNAARLANRMVRERGITWFDVMLPPEDRHSQQQATADPSQDWRRTASACSRFPHLINRWEHEFLSGLPRFPRLSRKQRGCLDAIVVRLRACGCRV